MRPRWWRVAAFVLLFHVGSPASAAGPVTAADLKQEMARIRRSTNWEDPKAAADANRRIQELANQLTRAARPDQFDATGKPKAGSDVDVRNQLTKQVGSTAKTADLAETVRKDIEERIKEEDDPTIRNSAFLEQLDTLILDLSEPQGRAIADQLDRFKRVKRLMLLGGRDGVPVDLDAVLRKASALPLEELHVVGFRGFVRHVPDRIGGFAKLRKLSLVHNAIEALPASTGRLRVLEALYVDANPVSTLAQVVGGMASLRELGLVRTRVAASEVVSIQQLLPRCKVQTQ